MRRTLSLLLGLLLLAMPAAAQRPLLATTVQTTDTTANSVLVGCAVGSTTCTGGVKAGPIAGSTVTATGVGSFGSVAVTSGVTVGGTLGVTGITTLAAALGGTSATFSGTVTGNLFSGSGASLTSIPETAITNGSLLARVADNETISGTWNFTTTAGTVFGSASGGSVVLQDTAAAANTKNWLVRSVATVFSVTACNDLFNTCTDGLTIARSTATPALATFSTPMAYTAVITPTAISGTTNNYAPTNFATAYLVRLTTGAASPYTLTGLAGGVAGRQLVLCNSGTSLGTLVLNTEDGGSTAANRFQMSGGANLLIGDCVTLLYDGTGSRWVVPGR